VLGPQFFTITYANATT